MPIEFLPVKLNEAELLTRAEELGQKVKETKDAQAAAKSVAGEWKTKIDKIDGEVTRLARVCREKEEARPVETREVMNHSRRTVDMVRIDTGEIIRFRSMTERELVRPLFPVEELGADDRSAAAGE
jgi:hypothetical protein